MKLSAGVGWGGFGLLYRAAHAGNKYQLTCRDVQVGEDRIYTCERMRLD